MRPNVAAGAMPERTNESGFDRGAAITRSLLGYGVLVGPFYLAVGLIQAFLREGFNFMRHPLSVLANGPSGWVQTANFVLSGLMVLAAAVGFKRVLGPKSRAASGFLGAFGASMLVAAVFRADPMDGFPVGTPVGPPTSISTMGLIHFIAGTVGFVSLAVSCFFTALAMSRRNTRSIARLSVLSGLAVVLGFFGGFLIPGISIGTLGIWFAVVVGWAWLAVTSLHLYRVAPDPNCAPQSG
ncbi:MAG: DUF998 domain-containing protein [Gemmatimonadota bacterium]